MFNLLPCSLSAESAGRKYIRGSTPQGFRMNWTFPGSKIAVRRFDEFKVTVLILATHQHGHIARQPFLADLRANIAHSKADAGMVGVIGPGPMYDANVVE